MRRNEDVLADDHREIFDQPDRYTFLDISQNNAWSGLGQKHYDNVLHVRDYIADIPRPINNIKNYGATRHGEEESIARFCRIVFAGAASSRFHRPHPIEDPDAHESSSDYGLGLSPKAQKIIQSMRYIVDEMIWGTWLQITPYYQIGRITRRMCWQCQEKLMPSIFRKKMRETGKYHSTSLKLVGIGN
ncbi:MAG TPA: hypothetical protein VK957_11725 [Lunatimonas sp.]|nr:hypothetical protein [Lunatimonas sp.]